MISLKIYLKNHIEVKIFPTMIWVHKEQATLENAPSRKCKGTRQNMFVTKHNNVDQTFWISTFYVFLDFWHKSKKILIKNNNVKKKKHLKRMQTNKQFSTQASKKTHNQA